MNTKCSNCKNLQQSVYMKLEGETLYNCWCKVGDMKDGTCNKFIAKNNLSKDNKTKFNCNK